MLGERCRVYQSSFDLAWCAREVFIENSGTMGKVAGCIVGYLLVSAVVTKVGKLLVGQPDPGHLREEGLLHGIGHINRARGRREMPKGAPALNRIKGVWAAIRGDQDSLHIGIQGIAERRAWVQKPWMKRVCQVLSVT